MSATREFNRECLALLQFLSQRLRGEKGIKTVLNGFKVAKSYNSALPREEYKRALEAEELVELGVVKAIQRNDPDFFFRPEVYARVPLLKDIDTEKWLRSASKDDKTKVWSHIRAMTECAGWSLTPEADAALAAQAQRAAAEEAHQAFNHCYRDFLENLSVAFPNQEANEVALGNFSADVAADPSLPKQKFKDAVKEYHIMRMILQQDDTLLASSDVLLKLPYVRDMDLSSWNETMSLENKEIVHSTLNHLLMITTGVANMDTGFLDVIQSHAQSLAESANLPDNPENLDPKQIYSMGLQVLQNMEQQGGGMQALLETFQSSGGGNFDPDMVNEVFDSLPAGMLDSFRPALEGLTSGSTGAPAFGGALGDPRAFANVFQELSSGNANTTTTTTTSSHPGRKKRKGKK